MSEISIQKTVFNKDTFEKVIDTRFHQLLSSEVESESFSFTLEDFFQLYEDLLYQIPKEGDVNSHTYLLNKEAEYLGINIDQTNVQSLLAEITALREQVLSSQQLLKDLSSFKTTGV